MGQGSVVPVLFQVKEPACGFLVGVRQPKKFCKVATVNVEAHRPVLDHTLAICRLLCSVCAGQQAPAVLTKGLAGAAVRQASVCPRARWP